MSDPVPGKVLVMTARDKVGIAIRGGSGYFERAEMTVEEAERHVAHMQACIAAARAGAVVGIMAEVGKAAQAVDRAIEGARQT